MTANQPEARIDFKSKQREFAAFIRDPDHQPAPADVSEERMLMYRDLFFNNLEGFLSGNFPVLRSLLDDSDWLHLVQDFFSTHSCTTPYFSEISEEFLSYLQHERNKAGDFPFLLELAHYEWTEMSLAIAKDEAPPKTEPVADILLAPLALSPLAWPLAYRYPVHRISSEFVPERPPEQNTFLIVCRDIEDEVNFIEITPMTYRLLAEIDDNPNQRGGDYLKRLVEESGRADPAPVIEHGQQILQELAERGIIYTR